VFFNAFWCSQMTNKLHKGIEFCNDLLPCVFQCITAFYLSHNICNSTEFGYDMLSYVFQYITMFSSQLQRSHSSGLTKFNDWRLFLLKSILDMSWNNPNLTNKIKTGCSMHVIHFIQYKSITGQGHKLSCLEVIMFYLHVRA